MEALSLVTNLVSLPGEALSTLLSGTETTSPPPFDEDTIRMIIYNLWQRDSREQQTTLEQHYAPDVTFSAGSMIHLKGRDELARFLRGSQVLMDVKPEVTQLAVTRDRALVLVDQHVAYKLWPITFWRRLNVPTLITLHFGKEGMLGSDVIISQNNSTSLSNYLWLGQTPVFDWVYNRLWAPYSGAVLATTGKVVDAFISSYSSSLKTGAGHVQALIWSLQDVAQASGLPIPGKHGKMNRQYIATTTTPAAAAVPWVEAPAAFTATQAQPTTAAQPTGNISVSSNPPAAAGIGQPAPLGS
eukprot:jgi/Chrzof1/5941/Cz16g21110.t1